METNDIDIAIATTALVDALTTALHWLYKYSNRHGPGIVSVSWVTDDNGLPVDATVRSREGDLVLLRLDDIGDILGDDWEAWMDDELGNDPVGDAVADWLRKEAAFWVTEFGRDTLADAAWRVNDHPTRYWLPDDVRLHLRLA